MTPARHAAHANEVRIVGGEFRSRRLHFHDAPGLRPTPDRVRETLFNWLGQDLAGMSCLDAFAGSGALGFEAASRHAEHVVMLESSRAAVEMLKHNRELLKASQIEIFQTDSLHWMRNSKDRFDLVMLDPPFDSNLMRLAVPIAAELLNQNGWMYAEQMAAIEAPDGFIIHREGRAGKSRYALLKRT